MKHQIPVNTAELLEELEGFFGHGYPGEVFPRDFWAGGKDGSHASILTLVVTPVTCYGWPLVAPLIRCVAVKRYCPVNKSAC